MRFGVLGPLAVWTEAGRPVSVPGAKVRALLADLLAADGRTVSADRLVDDLWGEELPANPAGSLQVRVSQLRKALEEAEPGGRDLVVSRSPGYQLQAAPDAVDCRRFQALFTRAQACGDLWEKSALLTDALALWRGPAYADFADGGFTRAVIIRLEEQRLAALEEHAEVRLALGDHGLLVGELGDLVARHPLRERLRAAHMRALYGSGRQSEALASYAELRSHLADELGLDPGPELAALHQSILQRDPSLAPGVVSPAPPPRPRTNLPATVSELIGRDEAVAEMEDLLLESARLVTLTGSGGVGKTRIAVETGRRLIERCPDGVWLAELAPLDTSDGVDRVADAILAALDIRDAGDPVAPADRLTTALRGRTALLVLDNCEHVVDAVAKLVESLLRAAPEVRVLATSREALAVAGEVVWGVPPLETPVAAATPAELERSSAARLFVARAAAAARDFTLTEENAAAVAQVCRRLDGIPLALELAATRVRALGVQGLVERLDDRFRLLADGHRGAPARQRTLMSVIDWSWDLLTEPERVVLRRLSVHAGGCTLEAAEAVCADPPSGGLPSGDVLNLLIRLVDRSLVVRVEHETGPRYRLLESVAAYCTDRLREAGELEIVEERAIRYYAALAVRAESHLRGHDQREWLRRLDAEAANLRSSIDRAVERRAAHLALELVGALTWYWILRGRIYEARRSLAAALGIAGESATPAGLEASGARAKAIAWQAGIAVMQGDLSDWEDRRDAALRGSAEITDAVERARVEWFLGFVTVSSGAPTIGEELVNRSLDAFRRVGDEWGEAAALGSRAMLAHSRGNLAALERDAERSVELFRRVGDRWGELTSAEWLGALAELTGDYERCARIHRDGLRLARELGLWPEVCTGLAWLGWVAVQLGDFAQAEEYCQQALRVATEQGYFMGQGFAELGLGFAARKAGRLDEAETRLRDLLDKTPSQGSEPPSFHVPTILSELGFAAELRGDAIRALDLHLEACDSARRMSSPGDLSRALEGLAGALALAGQHVPAARVLGAADASRRSAGMPVAPAERADIDRAVTSLRSELGGEAFAAEFERGGKLNPEGAEALARESTT